MLTNKESLDQIIVATPGLQADPVALGEMWLESEIVQSLLFFAYDRNVFKKKKNHKKYLCSFAGVLQDKDLFVQFTDPNMLDMWVRPRVWPSCTGCSVKRKIIQILICLCLVGWSALTQLSSTPSSWCCTRWPAACPRRPVAALPATSLPAPTATCQVGQEDGAVVTEMYRTTPPKVINCINNNHKVDKRVFFIQDHKHSLFLFEMHLIGPLF